MSKKIIRFEPWNEQAFEKAYEEIKKYEHKTDYIKISERRSFAIEKWHIRLDPTRDIFINMSIERKASHYIETEWYQEIFIPESEEPKAKTWYQKYIIRFEPGNKEQQQRALEILRSKPYRKDFSKLSSKADMWMDEWVLYIDELWDIYDIIASDPLSKYPLSEYIELPLTEAVDNPFGWEAEVEVTTPKTEMFNKCAIKLCDFYFGVDKAWMEPEHNENIYNKIQTEEFFSKKANRSEIKEAFETLKNTEETFRVAGNTADKIVSRVLRLIDNLSAAINHNNFARVQELLTEIKETTAFTDKLAEFTINGIDVKFNKKEEVKFDAEKSLGL